MTWKPAMLFVLLMFAAGLAAAPQESAAEEAPAILLASAEEAPPVLLSGKALREKARGAFTFSRHAPLVALPTAPRHAWALSLQQGPAHGSGETGFQWAPALRQSLLFLTIQHTARLGAQKTRENLKGPYWSDYVNSIQGVHGRWSDGDSFTTAYLGHPMMGSMAGYIQVHNDPRGRDLVFANTPAYWKSRLKALAWSAAYSTQFEIGPLLSEAGIGNVGLAQGSSGYVDLVTTPVGGLGFIVLEDWVDKAWIHNRERGGSGPRQTRWRRVLLNPNRAFANLLRWKAPWHRDTRP